MTFLAKNGKIFGPYSDEDFARLEQGGRLREFAWIWRAGARTWAPLDPAPPPPDTRASSSNRSAARGGSLTALFRAQGHWASGALLQITPDTYELRCAEPGHGASCLPLCAGTAIALDVFDEASGTSELLRGSVSGFSREVADGARQWVYTLRAG